MKQFLHSSGPTIVASLQNKAYALISKSLDKSLEEEKASSSPEKDVFILELRTKSVNNEHSNKDEGSTSCEKIQNEEYENEKDKGLSQNQIEQKQMNTIQAVSSYCDAKKGLLYYAVSRYDKSLSIYATPIEIEIQEENGENEGKNDGKTLGINPMIVHKAVKRCCSLAFALISPKDKGKESTLVIVAGDLNGDATAYATESIGENNSRVLLGHTASMLTSIEIVEGDHGAKILTSDRDEKVRISSFPNCFHVEGYLLGHASYVSDVKIVPNFGSSCVTCSGDGTVRLFDYETMQEKFMVQLQGLCENGNNGDDAEEDNTPIPVRLAVNSSGTVIAVMYDSSTSIQLYSVVNDGNILLELAQTIDCQHTPLGIIFSPDGILNVLVREPKLIRLKCKDNGFNVVEDQISMGLQAAIEHSQKIAMPKSLLEVDENTGKLKLKKLENKANESFVKTEPWLRKERVEVYKQNVKRRKQRKFEKEKLSIVD